MDLRDQKPNAAYIKAASTNTDKFKDIAARVNGNLPTELLSRIQTFSGLSISDDSNNQETFLELLKTDDLLEALLTFDIYDKEKITQLLDTHPKDRGDILAARGTLTALKKAEVSDKKLMNWIEKLHTLERYNIAASDKSLNIFKGEVFKTLINIGFGMDDVEDWHNTAVALGWDSKRRTLECDIS